LPAPIVAALSLVVATGLYGGMGALVKLMGERYSIGELVFYRGFFATLVLLALAPGRGGWGVFRTSRPAGHAMRALAGLGGMSLTFAAITLLPLAEAAALGFAAPLLTTALAGPLLGERVGPWRWAAIAIGLGGVLIIVQPGSSAFSWGAPLALAGAFCSRSAGSAARRAA
jgi:drug/metabolite transporter (DMT)-like permease